LKSCWRRSNVGLSLL